MISQAEDTIIGEYIRFCHIFDEQRKKFGYTTKAIQSAMEICKKENVLTDYLASTESEVAGIMLSLWDEEKALEIHMQAMEKEAREQDLRQGLEQGLKQGLEQGREQGAYTSALRRSEAFLEAGKITLEDIPIFFPELTIEDISKLKKKFY